MITTRTLLGSEGRVAMSEATLTPLRLKAIPLRVRRGQWQKRRKQIRQVVVAVLLLSSCVALSSVAIAQGRVDPSRLYPIPSEVKYALESPTERALARASVSQKPK